MRSRGRSIRSASNAAALRCASVLLLEGSHDPGNGGHIASAKGKGWAKVCLADHDPDEKAPSPGLLQ